MPVQEVWCDGCERTRTECPDCGSTKVTLREGLYTPAPQDVIDYGLGLEDGESIEYTHVCWNCGWEETVEMTVERTEHPTGEE